MLATIPEAIEDIKAGKFIIIIDDKNRENEGDIAIAAEHITPETINFMTKHARGLICLPIIKQRLDELGIPLMVQDNTSRQSTAFTVSVEAKHNVTTGISAFDRAQTIKTVIDPNSNSDDLVRPGHIFPIRARDGGVLVRAGHTEAIVDIARLAGLYPAGVICEVIKEDGTMARLPELKIMASKYNLKIVTIADLITYRLANEKLVQQIAKAKLPTAFGEFTIMAYKSDVDAIEHVALVKGNISGDDPVLVRVHSACLTGDIFGSLRCDCGAQLKLAMQNIAKEGKGVFLYMQQEGRGIGLHNKLRAYALQDQGMDTVEANVALGFAPDLRDYGIGAQILADLGLHNIRLLTNNSKKVVGLQSYGLKIVETVPLLTQPNPHNIHYLKTKQEKLGHSLNVEEVING
ncbi:MAG: bifunctional 3,4-dihydroxy-2-butanone-4-phosphate synthase/GTP cyclohydrolase II [Dehalococcoidia bacterium]|nr:bifunctional 3,4-dihydroxy-2-butanone-4-phosphate synthase/GTP cyclohydrolase II [Dehalococcoidia bacterium]